MRELERIAPLLILYLDAEDGGVAPKESFRGRQRLVALDALSEVVLTLRHFFGLRHPVAEALAQRVRMTSQDAGLDNTVHTTAVTWAVGAQQKRLEQLGVGVRPPAPTKVRESAAASPGMEVGEAAGAKTSKVIRFLPKSCANRISDVSPRIFVVYLMSQCVHM